MIKTRKDLREYIRADEARYSLRSPRILGWFLGDESYVVVRYLRVFRKLEFYTNKRKYPWDYIPYTYYLLLHRRLLIKTGIRLIVNTVGKGLYIPHYMGGVICNCKTMGDNCIVTSGVVLGNKGESDSKPTIGKNVEIAIGAKVIGNVCVGDNAIIAPNSVVVKDVPANTVVSGIPAKFLKERTQ